MLTLPPRPSLRCAGRLVVNDRLGGQLESGAGDRTTLVAAGAAEAAGVSDANSNLATSLDLCGLPDRAASLLCRACVQLGGGQGCTDERPPPRIAVRVVSVTYRAARSSVICVLVGYRDL